MGVLCKVGPSLDSLESAIFKELINHLPTTKQLNLLLLKCKAWLADVMFSDYNYIYIAIKYNYINLVVNCFYLINSR